MFKEKMLPPFDSVAFPQHEVPFQNTFLLPDGQ